MSSPSQRIADLSSGEKRALLAQLLHKQAGGAKSLYPLSYNQQGIWFLYQLAPESAVYNVNFAARIASAVNVPALRRTLQALVDRHPSLRTTFPGHLGKPVQQVHRHLQVHFDQVNGAAWSEAELNNWLLAEAYRPFDLERGPLLRVSLIMRSAQEYILLLVVHHIVIDFWSLAVLLNELGALYPAQCVGVQAHLPPLDLQYTDYVRWQAELLAGPEGERLWTYWRSQLAGELPVLDLPTDRLRPATQTYRGASHDFTLEDELSGRLRSFAKDHGTTLYMVLLSVFQILLSYHTGQEDLQVGSPMVGRSRAEFEGIVGLFTNPVVLRANLSGDPAYPAFLAQVRQTVLGALEHQDFPTVLLVERLRPLRDLSRPPLCQVMFVLDKPHRFAEPGSPTFAAADSGLRMNPGGLMLESFALERRAATLDLVLLIIETPGSLSASMRYNTDLFAPITIARMSAHFEALLRHVIERPATSLNVLKELLAAVDRQEQALLRIEHRELNNQKLLQVKRKAPSASQLANGDGQGMPKYTNANGRY
jgi:condensation domain-containing protein